MRRDATGIELDVELEAVGRELRDPRGARAHGVVGRFRQVIGRRRKQDVPAASADVGHGPARVRLAQVLQDLDADDQIVAVVERVRGRSHPTVTLDVGPHLPDGVGRDVEPVRLDSAIAQRLHQEALGASDVEDAPGLDLGHHVIGDRPEELEPLGILAIVGDRPERRGEVVLIVGVLCHTAHASSVAINAR